MAYSLNNPPALYAQAVGGYYREWVLKGTDATTVVRAVNYITNARDLGMKVGDVLFYIKTDAAPITVQQFIVSAINATTGAGDLSDGTAITATNTD